MCTTGVLQDRFGKHCFTGFLCVLCTVQYFKSPVIINDYKYCKMYHLSKSIGTLWTSND